MVDGFDGASQKDKAVVHAPEKTNGIDIQSVYAKQETKPTAPEERGGIYGANVIDGLGREAVLFKRAVLDNGVAGIKAAVKDEWDHKGELAGKVIGGFTMGAAMRLLTPKKGVAKAIAGSAMATYFTVDALKPLIHGMGQAWSAHNAHDLNAASKELSTNLGKFAIDSSIGMATGVIGAKGAGALLESKSARIANLPGVSKLRQFDVWKEEQLTSDQKPVGKFLNARATSIDNYFDRVQDRWNPFKPVPRPTVELPPEVKIQRLAEAADKIFERLGSEDISTAPKFHHIYNDAPDGMDHSDFLDSLINKSHAEKPLGVSNMRQQISSGETPLLPVDASPAVPDSVPGVEAASLLSKHTDAIAPNISQKSGSVSQPKLDLDPAVISKVAAVARASQAQWTPDKVNYADYRDAIQAPAIAVSDTLRVGSMLRPEYDFSTKQIIELTAQISSAAAEKKAGQLLQLHNRANLQLLARRPDTIDYNNFNDELHGSVIKGMRLAGVSESVMSGKVPALTAVTDDKGSGYYIIPQIDGILERPLLVVPRSMSGVKSTMSGGIRHEESGHADTGQVLQKFPENVRDDLIGAAVDNAMRATNALDTTRLTSSSTEPPTTVPEEKSVIRHVQQSLAKLFDDRGDFEDPIAGFFSGKRKSMVDRTVDTVMSDKQIPNVEMKFGKETITKSNFFKRLLYAEAEENTADFMGTATGGFDTPLTLGVLLQSIRKGGYLETRNVYGEQFEHGIEPHGIDRWRIKFCAETMRQISPDDPVVKEYADALDLYAQKASRPGETNYIFASVDNAGETISIPMNEWDAVIPHIIKAQLDTPLDALKTEKFVQAQLKDPTLEPGEGDLKTLRDIIWGHSETVRNIDTLANRMVDSVHSGQTELAGGFNNKEFTIGQVFSAGLIAWLRATRRGEDPTVALEKIDAISEKLRATYRVNNPHLTVLTPRVSTVMQVDTVRGINVAAKQAVSNLAGQNRNIRSWTENNTNWLAGSTGANLTGDLMDVDKKQKELLGN